MEVGDNLLPSGVAIPAQASETSAQDPPQVATNNPLLSNAESISQDDSDPEQSNNIDQDKEDSNEVKA